MNVISTLNSIQTPSSSIRSKQNARADEMRRVHPTYVGYIDVSQSADTGMSVGMTKQMCISASISGSSSGYILKKILAEDPNTIDADDITPDQVTSLRLHKIFVNGDLICYCTQAHLLILRYRMQRRCGDLHWQTTVASQLLSREIYFWTDLGRMLRPLIIVYNNLAEFVARRKAGESNFQFRQWIKLTKDHIRGLQSGKITMDTLRQERIIEYIAPAEQENTMLAPNILVLRNDANNFTHMYTHCDIDQAILGIVSLAAPKSHHSNTTRNTYYTNHRKQSIGWFSTAYAFRSDKGTSFQHYCERPLVSTFSDSFTKPNGMNLIVALTLHGGYNQEDSITLNRSSVDCGMFNAAYYNNEKTELETDEQFGNPDAARTVDIKSEANYEHVVDGFIAEGTIAENGHVLIVKSAKIPKPIDQYTHIDKSIIYKKDYPAFIEKVIATRNVEDHLIAKVKYRVNRPINVGDKMCLDADHFVLCERGWVPIGQVSLDDKIATLTGKGGIIGNDTNGISQNANCMRDYISYQYPSALYKYPHNGKLYSVKTRDISLRVTPEHKMYCADKLGNEYKLVQADSIYRHHTIYKNTAIFVAATVPFIYLEGRPAQMSIVPLSNPICRYNADSWLELFGYWYSYGITEKGTMIIASEDESFIIRVKQLLINLEISEIHWICNGSRIACDDPNLIESLRLSSVGNRLPEYVWQLGRAQCRILLDSIMHDENESFVKKVRVRSTQLAHDVLKLAIHCQYAGRIEKLDDALLITVDTVPFCPQVNRGSIIGNVINIGNVIDNIPGIPCDDEYIPYNGYVYCVSVPGEVFMTMRDGCPCWTGNSSRTGNKGIVSNLVPRINMPYAEDGTRPDAMVNCHSIPTRMAINQILECYFGMLACRKGTSIDGTLFQHVSLEDTIAEMESYGIKYGGTKRLYSGRIGEWIDTHVFMGITTYQRIAKFVDDEAYGNRTGPTLALTHQPVSGRVNGGGLRLGEMEKDVFCAHGTMRALDEKFYKDSDGTNAFICRTCKAPAIVNEKHGIYRCKVCEDSADIVKCDTSWTALVLNHELAAMNVKMSFDMSIPSYSRMEGSDAK